ncbi:hypothetical protein [Blastococcus sp. CT_GayMR16]|uniref:hypothetical protein n=1 Tax=Blastococcus sp. CT_GayMR16 TaxID=2559607 RepID=UPI0010746090|nr:hypothetical protein [Blastococcus sp. CT_GayMR16]TFV90409.1 hypothetical protein E4P38_02925 [Blastococcus sp. CT_GayMR16]
MPDPAPLCIVGRRPHPATYGQLCDHHRQELNTWLHDIERESADLDPAPPTSSRYDRAGGGALASQRSPAVLDAIVFTDQRSTAHGYRHTGPVCSRCPTLAGRRCTCPPLDWRRAMHWAGCPRQDTHPSCLHILADRDEHEAHAEQLVAVLNVLHGLAQRVRDERLLKMPIRNVVDRVPGMPKPVDGCACSSCKAARWIRPIPIPPTISSERKILTDHLDWIARQDWVDELRRQLADLRGQLLRANRNQEDPPLSGHCYRLVDGVECGGTLWPAEPKHSSGYEDDAPDRPRAIVCELHPVEHRWERHELALLSLILERQRLDELPPAAPGPPPPPAFPAGPSAGHGDRLTAVLDQQRREDTAS